MRLPNPILQFREIAQSFEDPIDPSVHYDIIKGMWIDTTGAPLIDKLIETHKTTLLGPTTKTATREAVDQSESVSGPTMLTKTREGVDQSERIASPPATTVTRTREGVDQSEQTLSLPQTLITETREGIDRPENSSW